MIWSAWSWTVWRQTWPLGMRPDSAQNSQKCSFCGPRDCWTWWAREHLSWKVAGEHRSSISCALVSSSALKSQVFGDKHLDRHTDRYQDGWGNEQVLNDGREIDIWTTTLSVTSRRLFYLCSHWPLRGIHFVALIKGKVAFLSAWAVLKSNWKAGSIWPRWHWTPSRTLEVGFLLVCEKLDEALSLQTICFRTSPRWSWHSPMRFSARFVCSLKLWGCLPISSGKLAFASWGFTGRFQRLETFLCHCQENEGLQPDVRGVEIFSSFETRCGARSSRLCSWIEILVS